MTQELLKVDAAPKPPCDRPAGQMQPSAAQEPDAQKPDTDTPPKITLKSRAELRAILVNAGLGRTVAEKISQAGWAAISTTEADDDLAEACADLAQSLIANLRF